MTNEEVDAIMKEADLNEDGRLDYSEVNYHIPMSCNWHKNCLHVVCM